MGQVKEMLIKTLRWIQEVLLYHRQDSRQGNVPLNDLQLGLLLGLTTNQLEQVTFQGQHRTRHIEREG